MHVERIPIAEIRVSDYNPRIDLQPDDPEWQALQRSMDRWDVVEPLIWNKRTQNLVGGRQRLAILTSRGDTHVDVSVVDLEEAEERALNVALNKIGGRWDDSKLLDVLSKVTTDGLDLTLTGFDEAALAALAKDFEQPLFVPALPEPVPTLDATERVTAKDVAKAEKVKAAKFSGATPGAKGIQDVTCPHCGHEFGVMLTSGRSKSRDLSATEAAEASAAVVGEG